MKVTTCKQCWWEEGGKCYEGEPPRNEKGISTTPAIKVCNKFWSKRSALTSIIPETKLKILSEVSQ